MKKIKVNHVNPNNFIDLGEIIALPKSNEKKPTAQSEIQTFFGKLGIMKCCDAVEYGICIAKKRELKIVELEQHAKTEELLFAIEGDFITPVAPSIHKEGQICPDIERITAIRVNQGEGVIFGEGIWHWTPFPVDQTSMILVAFKENTPQQDFIAFNLEEEIAMYI